MPTAVAKPDPSFDDALVRDHSGQLVPWRALAACDPGPDASMDERQAMLAMFFIPEFTPRRERKELELAAKQVCSGCPVQLDCLEYALAAREHEGVWGGQTEAERRQILAHRAAHVALGRNAWKESA